ncbi:hypothetical protein DH2020_044023 [Rehmannia glutinosa]|uniref:Myb/SANT-like domain-containing protein n=1 Tax=Rehmannia glutinosa TaxID=99300 RepID=A0ABR0UJV3_REHGL
MESSGSVPRRGPIRKNTQCRRSWTVEEEHVLLHALKELVAQGFKCDNGFKSGYQNMLEHSMKQAFPGTTLRSTPHISSKIHVWKKDYGSISMILSRTRFRWNDSSNTLTVKEDIFWDEYVKIPNPTDENDHTSTYNPQNSARVSDNSQKKRKQKYPESDRFLNAFENFCEKTDARLSDIAKRIGFEQDASSSRKSLYDALDKMTFLTVESKIAVATQLSKKTEELDIFFSLSDENKATMVKMVLEGKF